MVWASSTSNTRFEYFRIDCEWFSNFLFCEQLVFAVCFFFLVSSETYFVRSQGDSTRLEVSKFKILESLNDLFSLSICFSLDP